MLFAPSVLLVLAAIVVVILLLGIRWIPNTKVGIVEKRLSGRGSIESGVIALKGEAGFQPKLLRGGLHYRLPFQYNVHMAPLVTIPQGRIGYVYARDGQQLPPAQALASNLKASDFQDASGFLTGGGQRGPQRKVLREGTYAINLALFTVLTEDRVYALPLDRSEVALFANMAKLIGERHGFSPVVIKGVADLMGIATVHDGPSLPPSRPITTASRTPSASSPRAACAAVNFRFWWKAPTSSTGCSRRSR